MSAFKIRTGQRAPTESDQIKPDQTKKPVDELEPLQRRRHGEAVPPPISMEVSH